MHSSSENRKSDVVLDQVRTTRDFQKFSMAVLVTKLLHKAFLNDLLVFSFVVSTREIDLFGDRLVPEIFQSLRVGVHFASLDSVLGNY